MKVLVAYATRHGATRGIAERIASRLGEAGIDATARSVTEVRDAAVFDAFVVGSAAYMFHWLKEGTAFVRRNRAVLGSRPLWLFSSGPLGTDLTDPQGRDIFEATVPREIPELSETLHARDHRVFFGALDLSQPPKGFAERFTRLMPAAKASLPQGDFRDWDRVDAWADEIAADLKSGTKAR